MVNEEEERKTDHREPRIVLTPDGAGIWVLLWRNDH